MGSKKQDPFWLRLFATLMLRLVYFSGAFLFIGFSLLGSSRHGGGANIDTLTSPATWLLVFSISCAIALIGPYAYQKHAQRGRGTLKQVRDRSKK